MLNGFRSSTNTPTDIRESPLAVGLLRLARLNPYKDALTISVTQRKVLDDKREEFQEILLRRKSELESELQKSENIASRRKNSDAAYSDDGSIPVPLDELEADAAFEEKRETHQRALNELHKYFQGRIDFINKRFQREWLENPRNKDESSVVIPGGGADSGYLAQAVGGALQVALAEVAEKRPGDPVEYLALCLYKHSANVHREQQKAVDELKLLLERDDAEREMNRKIRLEREANVIKLEEARRKEIFEEREKEVRKSIEAEIAKAKAEAEEAAKRAEEEAARKAEEEARKAEEEARKAEEEAKKTEGEEAKLAEERAKKAEVEYRSQNMVEGSYETAEEDGNKTLNETENENEAGGGEDQEQSGENKSLFTIEEKE